MAPDSRLRKIAIHGCTHGIYMDGGTQLPGISFYGTRVQDVEITGSGTGIRTAGYVRDVGAIERVRVELQGAGAGVGIHVVGAVFWMSDVTIFGTVGVRTVGGAIGTLERVTISAAGPVGPISGIDATDLSKVVLRDSTVGGLGASIRTSGSATVSAANTAFSGPIVGLGLTCFNAYQVGTLAPLAC